MSKPKYKVGDWVYITRHGRKPNRFFAKAYEVVRIHEHENPLPATNYYGVSLAGRYVYALDGYQEEHGWLPEEEITTAQLNRKRRK